VFSSAIALRGDFGQIAGWLFRQRCEFSSHNIFILQFDCAQSSQQTNYYQRRLQPVMLSKHGFLRHISGFVLDWFSFGILLARKVLAGK